MKKNLAFAITLTALAFPLFTLAHPGHGEHDGFSIIHYLVEPAHALASVTILTAAYLVYSKLKDRKSSSH